MEVNGILNVHDLHVWSITSYLHILSAHMVLSAEAFRDPNQILNKIKGILKDEYSISHSTPQLEKKGYKEVGEICSI